MLTTGWKVNRKRATHTDRDHWSHIHRVSRAIASIINASSAPVATMNALSGFLTRWFCECRRTDIPRRRAAEVAAPRISSLSRNTRCFESQTLSLSRLSSREESYPERDSDWKLWAWNERLWTTGIDGRDDLLVGVVMDKDVSPCESVRHSCCRMAAATPRATPPGGATRCSSGEAGGSAERVRYTREGLILYLLTRLTLVIPMLASLATWISKLI